MLGCLCGKAGTGHLCGGSAHSSGCVVNVNGSNAMAAFTNDEPSSLHEGCRLPRKRLELLLFYLLLLMGGGSQ